LATSATFAGRTLFDHVGAQGGRVLGVEIPMCYPAWPVEGRLLAGYPRPESAPLAAHPREWAAEIARLLPDPGYRDAWRGLLRPDASTWLRRQNARARCLAEHVRSLMLAEQPDFTMLVLREPDHIQHWFWDDHSRALAADAKDPVADVYRMADR